MSTLLPQTAPKKDVPDHPEWDSAIEHVEDAPSDADSFEATNTKRKNTKKRKQKLSTRAMIWIRRIHLFSGLFMLPWVLLYGFTALLFNHPTWMTDSKTEIVPFELSPSQQQYLPNAGEISEEVVEVANEMLAKNGAATIELVESDEARFTRQAFATIEDETESTTVVVDLNTGSGYLRRRTSVSNSDSVDKSASLDEGVSITVQSNVAEQFKNSLQPALGSEKDVEDLNFRGLPSLEFDALVDGKELRLRFTPQQRRRGSPPPTTEADHIEGNLTIVGSTPRDVSARSFLLRLHTAHGYPIQTNARWFWAIAVDLMFASMVFWGFSGLFMWWQIKRTRKIGFILLLASAVVATWLAIGMHWQIANA